MRKSDYAPDRPLGLLIAFASFFALVLSAAAFALLIAAGPAGRVELEKESDRLVQMGASRLLLERLDLFLVILTILSLLGILKGLAIYGGSRRGFLFGAAVNGLAFVALLPWTNWDHLPVALLNTAFLAVATGSLALYCVLRIQGRIGPKPLE
ncbi:MAG: hypothetical protein KatS3mg015_1679 [Fimbriimonadales bacterium]|nr:MAG: hypothetical protein KatS3mg015_1679 [Fimbriimonadales bacterium]